MRTFQSEKIPKPRCLISNSFTLPADYSALDIEIGSGVGEFAMGYAKNNSKRYLVAIEHTRTRFNTFSRLLAQNNLNKETTINNLQAVHANAIGWITHALTPNSVDRYFILYPNPEPKNDAKKWHRMPFFSKILETLKPGGTIEIATNIKSYHDDCLHYLKEQWMLSQVEHETWAKNSHLSSARTPFERKYLERNELCYRVLAVK